MASSNIKRITGQVLADYLDANVTGLSGRVSSVHEGPEKVAVFPSVALIAQDFAFTPWAPDEVEQDDDQVIVNVGEFDGSFELRLYCKSVHERELYEQRILDAFLSTEGAPGTLFLTSPALTVGGVASLYEADLKARLDTGEWSEELAFESRRYSFLDIELSFPALARITAATIDEIQVGLTNDLELDLADETISVDEDGAVSGVVEPAAGLPSTSAEALETLGRTVRALYTFDGAGPDVPDQAQGSGSLVQSVAGALFTQSDPTVGTYQRYPSSSTAVHALASGAELDMPVGRSIALLMVIRGVAAGSGNVLGKASGSSYYRLLRNASGWQWQCVDGSAGPTCTIAADNDWTVLGAVWEYVGLATGGARQYTATLASPTLAQSAGRATTTGITHGVPLKLGAFLTTTAQIDFRWLAILEGSQVLGLSNPAVLQPILTDLAALAGL